MSTATITAATRSAGSPPMRPSMNASLPVKRTSTGRPVSRRPSATENSDTSFEITRHAGKLALIARSTRNDPEQHTWTLPQAPKSTVRRI